MRRAAGADVRAWRHGFPQAVAVYAPRDLAVFAIATQAVTLTDLDDRDDCAALRHAFLTGYTRDPTAPARV